MRSVERAEAELSAELSQQRSRTLEEQKKREAQDALVRRLQKRVLLLTKVPHKNITDTTATSPQVSNGRILLYILREHRKLTQNT